ncbi:hypothetical protein Tco_1467210 [Tanacetum coccineum]
MSREVGYGITDTWDELVDAIQEIAPTTLKGINQRVTKLATIVSQDAHEICDIDGSDFVTLDLVDCSSWTLLNFMGNSQLVGCRDLLSSFSYVVWHVKYYGLFPASMAKMPPKRTTTTTTTTPMIDAAIKALIAQGVADTLAGYEATKNSGNGDDSHDSRSGRRTERAAREL